MYLAHENKLSVNLCEKITDRLPCGLTMTEQILHGVAQKRHTPVLGSASRTFGTKSP
jgi:hypothetical protein